MAEKLVVGIQQLNISAATYHNVEIKPTYVNFFFGNNGVGKTTIAREIAGLRTPANGVAGGDVPQNAVFEPGKTNRDYNILVYDQDFIRDNFRQLENLPGVFMVDEEGIRQVDELNTVKENKRQNDKEYGELIKLRDQRKGLMDKLEATLEKNCWTISKPIRERFPEAMMSGTKTMKGFLSKVRTIHEPVGHKVEDLEALYDTAFDKNAKSYSLFNKVADISIMEKTPGVNLLSSRIVSSSDTDFARFIKVINASDWVRQGHEKFYNTPENKCPYCQQPMPASFEKNLADCFDDQYKREVDELGNLLQAYKRNGNDLWMILKNNLKEENPKIDVTKYKEKMVALKELINSNIQKIEQKIKEPGSEVSLTPIAPCIEELNSMIDSFNLKINENNSIVKTVRSKKVECTEQVWELLAWMVWTAIEENKRDFTKAYSDYEKFNAEAKKKYAYSLSLAEKITELNKHTINTEEAINNMNQMLRDSGFQGFSIKEHPDYKNQYQIIREDGSVAKELSEGERNFIAFLYFCNLVHGNGSTVDAQKMVTGNGENVITDGRDMRDKIVVIDDPVSSMDSSSLFIVSSLVRRMIAICLNNVTLGEKQERGDYIKQMFILTHNAFFHREITVNQEKNYLRVSFYLITKYDNESRIKPCVTQNKEKAAEQMNYNPVQNSYAALWMEYVEVKSSLTLKNVIRRILEYYFIQICGYDGQTLQERILIENRKLFVTINEETGEEDSSELRMVAAMINYITSDVFGVNEGFHFIDDSIAPEIYRDITRRIFKAMGQPQHYEMMETIAENNVKDTSAED